jgi:hypothetical protein
MKYFSLIATGEDKPAAYKQLINSLAIIYNKQSKGTFCVVKNLKRFFSQELILIEKL